MERIASTFSQKRKQLGRKQYSYQMLTLLFCREEANDYCELYGGYLAQVKKFMDAL